MINLGYKRWEFQNLFKKFLINFYKYNRLIKQQGFK